METNKVTSKGQTTITLEIRNALNLSTGDELLFELEGDQDLLRKASVIDFEYHDFSFFSSRKRKK